MIFYMHSLIIFVIAGLQDRVLDLRAGRDRSSERYIFDESSVFDCNGKLMKENDCLFFPALSLKSSTPLLKGFRFDRFLTIICMLNKLCILNISF